MNKFLSIYKYTIPYLVIICMAVLSSQANAQTSPQNSNDIVDNALCQVGFGCQSATNSSFNNISNLSGPSTTSVSTSKNQGGIFSFFFGGSSSTTIKSILYGSFISKAYTKNQISLVRVSRPDSVPGELKTDEQIYEITGGKKHLIPNLDIFIDYGFKPQQVLFVSQNQLDKYSLARLIQVAGDKSKSVYFITGKGMIRMVLNQEVIESYGGRSQDIVVVSLKEFNFYPQNKYIYSSASYTGDIYLIDGNSKKYLTPMAVKGLEIRIDQVSEVNETEFNAYTIGKPVVY